MWATYDQGNQILREAGWPPVPAFAEMELLRKLSALPESDVDWGPTHVDAIVLDHYTPDKIRSLPDRWERNRLLESRLHILEEAVEAHVRELYHASIPPLYAHTEGMLAEAVNAQGQFHAVGEVLDTITVEEPPLPSDQVIRNFWEDEVRQNFEWGKPLPADASRHAIMHGADTSYGTETNSLKALLGFHHLHRILRGSYIDDRGTVHRPGCDGIRSEPEDLRFIKSFAGFPMHGIFEGESSCSLCEPSIPATGSPRDG